MFGNFYLRDSKGTPYVGGYSTKVNAETAKRLAIAATKRQQLEALDEAAQLADKVQYLEALTVEQVN